MTDEMSAKALYELMQPVWDAVPETRPRITDDEGQQFTIAFTTEFSNPRFVWQFDDLGEKMCGAFCSVAFAAALCRDAMRTCLESHHTTCIVHTDDLTTIARLNGRFDDRDAWKGESGPTPLHALAAACLSLRTPSAKTGEA